MKLTNIIPSLSPISLQVGFYFCYVENAVLNIFAFVKLFIYDNFLKRDCWIEYTFFFFIMFDIHCKTVFQKD